MATIELDVPTVHCRSRKLNIEESLEDVKGVGRSNVDLDAKRVTVDYDPATVDTTAITTVIEDAGYPVSSLAVARRRSSTTTNPPAQPEAAERCR